MLFAAPAVAVITVFFLVPLGLTFYMSLNDWSLLGRALVDRLRELHAGVQGPGLPRRRSSSRSSTRRSSRRSCWRSAWARPAGPAPAPRRALLPVGLLHAGRHRLRVRQLPLPLPGAAGHRPAVRPDQPARASSSADANWFAGHWSALLLVIVSVTWKFVGIQMLLLLAGLQSIPTELEEAARIDGARRWQVFRYITLPLLRPTLALVLVFSVAGSLLAFDQFYIMTSGRPVELDDHGRLPDLPRLLRAVPGRLRRGAVGAADGRPGRGQRGAAAAAAQHGPRPS